MLVEKERWQNAISSQTHIKAEIKVSQQQDTSPSGVNKSRSYLQAIRDARARRDYWDDDCQSQGEGRGFGLDVGPCSPISETSGANNCWHVAC